MDAINRINSFGWADWSLDSISIDYDNVQIKIIYPSDSVTRPDVCAVIHCNNFIGFSFVGHWDENIIESIEVDINGEILSASLQTIRRIYGNPPIPSLGGGVKRINNTWYQLNLKLIDGNTIKVACENFELKVFE